MSASAHLRRLTAAGRRRATGDPGTTDSHAGVANLVGIRAALAAGLAPVEALGAASSGALVEIASAARLGQPLSSLADQRPDADAGLQLLLRALAVAEHAGTGGGTGVEQALSAIRETSRTDRLLSIKTAQARGTATLMAVVPLAAWFMLVALDGRAIRFYTTVPGVATGAAAAFGMWAGRRWSRRLVDRASAAALRVDPLYPDPDHPDFRRGLAVGAPTALAFALWLGMGLGAVLGTIAAVIAARAGGLTREHGDPGHPGHPGHGRRDRRHVDLGGGGTPEATELLALALDSGLSVVAAIGLIAELGPVAARDDLSVAHRRLEAGWRPAEAFDGTRLRPLGELLAAVERWGAPAAPSLRDYAEELREGRRCAAEEAAERTQLALIFPTTLLTLPAFAVAIVPPLVWTGFAI